VARVSLLDTLSGFEHLDKIHRQVCEVGLIDEIRKIANLLVAQTVKSPV